MSELAAAFCDRNSAFEDAFEQTTVIVQSFGLGQWLKLQLAQRQGIATNVDCVLPAAFLWRLYQSLVPDSGRLTESPFDPDRLSWRIMRLLESNPGLSGAVTSYLGAPGDPSLRLYQLSHELALLIDEYLMYRPQWMLDWAEKKGEPLGHAAWQADLWRLILADLPEFQHLHRADLHRQAVTRLKSDQEPMPWHRISVFGLSTIPPLQLEAFEALSDKVDVDIYFMNPCEHYWGDIVSEKDKARRSIRALINKDGLLEDADYLEVGNPLLSSLGKQGREYLELLLESTETVSEELFVEADPGTALGRVKNDVLNLTYGEAFGSDEPPQQQKLADDSIQVHACHSRLREVEVLHDAILRTMQDHENLDPADIIVMVPDISQYAPFIQSVFSGSMPFRLTDKSTLGTSELLGCFLSLLELPDSRITASDILDLLGVDAVMKRFELTQDNLETIAHWIDAAAIRWEVNGAEKEERWALPGEHQNTWRFGLSRLLLGFAMSDRGGLWHGQLPVEISPSDSELLGTLCHIIDLIEEFRRSFSEERSLADWQQRLTHLIRELFDPSGADALEVDLLLQSVDKHLTRAEAAGFDRPVSHRTLHHILKQSLSTSDSRAGFISGGVTFATLVPMRSIPFRMVCLLGMNDGEYPRDVRPHSFDMMAAGPAMKGDRSRKLDDRYLFLEALLSAEERIHVSYIGRGIRDNKVKPPSAILGEFTDYLATIFSDFQITEHALQPFHPRYYMPESRDHSFDPIWFEALNEESIPPPFVSTPLARDESLVCTSLQQLTSFYRHPARYFLQQRLGVYLDQDDLEVRDSESFDLSGLERFDIADRALAELLAERDIETFKSAMTASGRLLTGDSGQQQLARELNRAKNIHEALAPLLAGKPEPLPRELKLKNQTLYCHLPDVYNNQLISWRVGSLNASQLMSAWISHLAANLLAGDVTSIYVTRGKDDAADRVTLAPVGHQDATTCLEMLLGYYDEGTAAPLFLPPGAGQTHVDKLQGKKPDSALADTANSWMNNSYEGPDRNWQRLFELPAAFDQRFAVVAQQVWQPIMESVTDG